MASTPVTTAEFQLTEREFVRALRQLSLRNRGPLIVAGVTLPLIVGGVVIGTTLLTIAGVAILLAVVWVWVQSPRQQWRRNPRRSASQQFTFDEDGILIVTADTRAEVAWDYYTEVIEIDDLYVLQGVNKLCNVLPRRVFSSPDEESRFRDLIRRHASP